MKSNIEMKSVSNIGVKALISASVMAAMAASGEEGARRERS
jgi:hypothetical protein